MNELTWDSLSEKISSIDSSVTSLKSDYTTETKLLKKDIEHVRELVMYGMPLLAVVLIAVLPIVINYWPNRQFQVQAKQKKTK